MKKPVIALSLTLALGIVLGFWASTVLNAQQAPVKRTEVLRTELPGMDGKEGILYVADIAAGGASGKHYHPGSEVLYMLEGSFTLELEGKSPVTLKPGEAFLIPPKHTHNAKNVSATDPAKVVVFLMADKGQPIATAVTPAYFWK
jgi:quercetin dioxygenase-like cupin family protein